ncbi:uncharacterized protein [Musca autumnalis]|uniref:uncharacterized protein n=1 Tax=Musca autumnalis TaxID=221902 RepID=UPI003CEB02AC
MSLERTPIDKSNTNDAIGETSDVEPTGGIDPTNNNSNMICHSCNEPFLAGQECLSLKTCSHTFHRNCMENHMSTASECPSCKIQCQLSDFRSISLVPKPQKKFIQRGKGRGAMAKTYYTRNAKKNLFQEQTNLLDFSTDLQGAVGGMTPTQPNHNNELLPDASRPLGTKPFQSSIDYGEIQKMVELSVCNLLSKLNILPSNTPSQNLHNQNNANINGINVPRNHVNKTHTNISNSQALPQQTQRQTQSQPRFSNSPNQFSVSNQPLQPDKITTIIQNWHLKFDGSSTGLTVDEFLYRVTTLTEDTFNGDFSLICKNLNILLSGKAREWYWRYRKNASPIVWEDFCDSIKFQYRDFKTSFDIREEIRNRKQKLGESFDSFFEAVTSIHDRLPTQMSELELIEILTRNLRPEIRQELLYIPVNSLAHLRKLVHMRENFLNDDYVKKQLLNRPTNPYSLKRQIAELSDYPINSFEDNSESINAVQGFPQENRCWNCDEIGHFWENCLNERKVFCYGCGAKETYKPNCAICADAKTKCYRNFRQGNPPKKNP